ncbi:uncharacterized protein LOC113389434 [Ctenocephalides felis]|uniref:uncharacterized protein LOC113389434 n=2 Tax=Ctenocephalides felis TaxID=7515 RepID=UPI000E6E4239|nr:uncharacterized protein LOC113389434 [Ctenocephalides felis]
MGFCKKFWVLAFLLVCINMKFSNADKTMNTVIMQCIKEKNVNVKELGEIITNNKPDKYCFHGCVFQKLGYFVDGKLSFDAMIAGFNAQQKPDSNPNPQLEDILANCIKDVMTDEKNDDACIIAERTMHCVVDHDKQKNT